MLRIAYGYIPDDNDDPILRLNAKAMEQVAPASNPANFLINVLPFRKSAFLNIFPGVLEYDAFQFGMYPLGSLAPISAVRPLYGDRTSYGW